MINSTVYKIIENSFLRHIWKKQQSTMLGRWQHKSCDKFHDLKSFHANMDHCGDKICGMPHLYRRKDSISSTPKNDKN